MLPDMTLDAPHGKETFATLLKAAVSAGIISAKGAEDVSAATVTGAGEASTEADKA
jgi:hypothetical protein